MTSLAARSDGSLAALTDDSTAALTDGALAALTDGSIAALSLCCLHTSFCCTVAFLNILLVSTSSVVAALFPNAPGEVLGYAGAISGTLYVCLLPILVHLAALHSRGQLTTSCIVMHALLIAIGSALFVHGFFVG